MKYKSKGETAIARVLETNNIDFKYEYPLLIKEQRDGDSEKLRIWYPDFWLPRYSIIIEFFGMRNSDEYDNETKRKKEIYSNLELDLIPVYPKTIKKDLQSYLIKSIESLIDSKKKHFKNRNQNL